jgi:acetyl esterase/lipase
VLATLTALALLLAPSAAAAPKAVYLTNVHYGSGPQRVLDVGRPAATKPARPAVVFIHGGGWNSGSKSAWSFALPRVVARGWVGFSIDYRLEPPAAFPAPVDDTLAAVRWIRRNAARFGVDPKRIAVVGDSAGAHLALLAATKGAGDPQTRVAAAVSWSGPTDMTALGSGAHTDLQDNVIGFVGCAPAGCPDRFTAVSPIHFVTPATAPILLLNSRSEVIPASQATEMAERLRAAGVPYGLALLPGSRHGLAYEKDAWPRTLRFLAQRLR